MENVVCKVEKQANLVIMTLMLDNLLWDDNIELKKLYNSLLDEGNKNIILDLSNTSYVSSVVLASFVYMLKRAKEAGGNLILCSINPKVQEVLGLTNLDKVFDITSNRQEAISKLGGG
ncbi:MAG: STAS domain-containing protein [Candidatus Omnitrophica bacterium]|nr:STAS domain-containing protein [Candidatus Omnitrophota bacterium]